MDLTQGRAEEPPPPFVERGGGAAGERGGRRPLSACLTSALEEQDGRGGGCVLSVRRRLLSRCARCTPGTWPTRGPSPTTSPRRSASAIGSGMSSRLIGIPIGPTWHSRFFFGADFNGRDVAVRLLYGGRNSLADRVHGHNRSPWCQPPSVALVGRLLPGLGRYRPDPHAGRYLGLSRPSCSAWPSARRLTLGGISHRPVST